jgi:hypothetical protein
MTARFSAPLLLASSLLLASPAFSQSVIGQTMNGSDTLNLQAKGARKLGSDGPRFQIKQPNAEVSILDTDDAGNGTYSTAFDINGRAPNEPMDFDVTIETTGKSQVLLLDDLTQIEASIALILRAHNTQFRQVNVTIDPASVRTKLKTKSNLTLNSKISIDLKFTATSSLRGYENMEGTLRLRPRLTATLPGSCVICGDTYTGTSKIETLLNRCGELNAGMSDATLVIDPDIDDDGSSNFTLTDEIGTPLIGLIGQAGKRLACNIGPAGQDILLTAIEAQILANCQDLLTELDTPALDARLRFLTCDGRTNSAATKISIDFFMSYRTLTVPANPGESQRQGPSGTGTIDASVKIQDP